MKKARLSAGCPPDHCLRLFNGDMVLVGEGREVDFIPTIGLYKMQYLEGKTKVIAHQIFEVNASLYETGQIKLEWAKVTML